MAHAVDPAAPEARAALAELCGAYWFPIYALIRRRGHVPDEALDLTQDYFARLLEAGVLASADPHKSRLRAFLRADCGYFLSHHLERARTRKRGGGHAALSIDARDAEGRYLREPVDATTPERLFDRAWALNLLDEVLKQLASEQAEAGRAARFEALQGSLGEPAGQASYADLAARLGTTEGAVQQAVQRLRKRYRAILRERIDERADVFALGSILAAILTGSPAFTGRTSGEILRKSVRGETGDALMRLEAAGAEAELVALAKDCLAVAPEDRPYDANVVADRITAYLACIQERVRAAERERAVAVARAVEERRSRKVQLALAASVLALTTLGGLSTTYLVQQRQARAAAGQRVIDRVTTLRGQALAQPEEIPRWEVALAAVEQADPAGDSKTQAQLVSLREVIRAGLIAARRDKALLDRLVDIRSAEADDPDGSITDRDYADAFGEAGLDVASLPPAELGARIKARPASVVPGLAGARVDWVATRRTKRPDAAGAARLSAAARDADPDTDPDPDPDPWRIGLLG